MRELNHRNTMRELNHRNSDGIDVFLLWNPDTSETVIEIHDTRFDSCVSFSVDAAQASDAFLHPFAYLHNPVGNSYPVAA